jgi:hypothetical protein
MKLFGDLDVRLDPWQVDYGAELPVAPEDEASPDEAIILDVEVPPGQWQPIAPASADTITRLVFVDGVSESRRGLSFAAANVFVTGRSEVTQSARTQR